MISDSALANEFWTTGKCAACPVIDMHGHMGEMRGIWFPRGDTDAMIRTMDSAGVTMLAFCHHAALFSPDVGNRVNIEAVRRYPDRLRAYLGVNPHYGENLKADLANFDNNADVFIGLKILAGYHKVRWDDKRYERAWKFADERKLAVLCHTWGGSAVDGVEQVRIAAERYPNIHLLLGHSLHGCWDDAIAVARDYPQLYLELTAVLDDRGVMEKFVAAGLSERLLFGTDLPWFDPHHGIGAVLSAEITDEDRHNILHRNAEKLLGTLGLAESTL